MRYPDLRVSRESGLGGRLLSDVQLTEDAVIVAVRAIFENPQPRR